MIVDNRKGITRNRSRKKFGSRDWSANASPIINRLQSGKVPPRFHYYDSFFLTVFSFAPRQYKINPRKIEASVPPTSRNSKLICSLHLPAAQAKRQFLTAPPQIQE